jgi:hypothetical protein
MRKSTALPFAFLLLAGLVAAAAGCSGTAIGGSAATGSTPTPAALPTTSCGPYPFPSGEQVQMVFPQKNGTNQPNLQGIVVAVAPNPLPTSWYFYVTASVNGVVTSTLNTAQIGFLATPSPNPTASAGASPLPTGTPLPTPSDTPAFANPIFEVASLGTFANSTQFHVFLANSTCSGYALNTFTTASTDLPSPTPTPSASPT